MIIIDLVYLLTEVFLFALLRSCLLYMLVLHIFMCQKYLTFFEKAKNVMLKDVVNVYVNGSKMNNFSSRTFCCQVFKVFLAS